MSLTPREQAILDAAKINRNVEVPQPNPALNPQSLVKLAANGFSFVTFQIPQLVPMTWALNPTQKLRMMVRASVDFHQGSYKYGPEAVLSLFSYQYPTLNLRSATNGKNFRVECMVPLEDHFLQIRRELEFLKAAYPELFNKLFMELIK